MADDRQGRDDQARDADRRQRERALAEELERWDETEPPVDEATLTALEAALAEVSFPARAPAVIESVGEIEVVTPEESYRVEDLLPDVDGGTFESPAEVRARVVRPDVARSLKRIVEANAAASQDRLGTSQREAYEKTLRALSALDADDDDEAVSFITDWIVEEMEDGKPPGSRAVRKRAAKYCRANGYEIRDDDWLGA